MTFIRVSDNGRYFVDQDGEPFFWLGDTQWDLFRDFTVEDAVAVMKRRKAQGFSVLQVMATGVGEGDKANVAGQRPWVEDDPARPNDAYFAGMDAVVREAEKLGLILVIGIYHQVQAARITMANARGYARWIGQRYRGQPHIVWTMYPKAQMSFLPVLRELAAGLQAADAQGRAPRHLITVHPDPSPTSSSFIHDEPWLDFNMNQPCITYEKIVEMTRADYARTPAKPTVMAEGGYEGLEFGRLQTALEIRKQAYWSHLAGGHHSYGHQDAWQQQGQWRRWIDSPGARDLSVYRRVLTSLPRWWAWVPDVGGDLLDGDEGAGLERSVAMRSEDGKAALIYVARSGAVRVNVRALTDGSTPQAHWIDPTTGRRTAVAATSREAFASLATPDGWEDALLLVTSHT